MSNKYIYSFKLYKKIFLNLIINKVILKYYINSEYSKYFNE